MTEADHIPQARDFMNRHVRTVGPDDTLQDVTDFLISHKLSNAPVVETDENGRRKLIGFLSEQDCLEHLSNELFYGRIEQARTARIIMKTHPVCVSPETDLFSLASIFVSHGYRHLPVVEDGYLAGIVSRHDILKAINEYYNKWFNQMELDHFPPDLTKMINLRFFPDTL